MVFREKCTSKLSFTYIKLGVARIMIGVLHPEGTGGHEGLMPCKHHNKAEAHQMEPPSPLIS